MSCDIIYDKYIFTYIPYVDFNIWLVLLLLSIIFFIASYASPRARLMFSGLGLLFSVAIMWGSMGLARLSYAAHETIITCNQTVENLTTTTEVVSYIPAVESLTSEWLTTICRVYVIILFLSFIWIAIESYLPKEKISESNEGGITMNGLDAVHDDKLHRVGGKR